MLKRLLTIFLLMIAICLPALATDRAPDKKMTAEEFLASLKFQEGKITLPGGIATLDLPDSFRYLAPDDAGRVLSDAWGNPPGQKTLGMIVPSNVSLLSRQSWGVIVTYDKDGHVKDDDADGIKYDELLQQMQKGIEDNNEKRKKDGYPPMSLIGWAEQPTYDKSSHKLYWAKHLRFDGQNDDTLNYNIRVLGRNGVLVLNAVAGMDQIGQIKQEMQSVNAFTNFTAGNGYNDFDDKTDKVAEYGIAALVAGGIAAKLGLFGKLFALLLAFKKVIVLAAAGAGSAVFKFFKRKKETSESAPQPQAVPQSALPPPVDAGGSGTAEQ
jgi:uncharacterized membrane-anchored protein